MFSRLRTSFFEGVVSFSFIFVDNENAKSPRCLTCATLSCVTVSVVGNTFKHVLFSDSQQLSNVAYPTNLLTHWLSVSFLCLATGFMGNYCRV